MEITMSDIYIAKQSVGQYKTGEVVDLNAERIKFLLEEGAIELQKPKAETKAKTEPKPTAKAAAKKD